MNLSMEMEIEKFRVNSQQQRQQQRKKKMCEHDFTLIKSHENEIVAKYTASKQTQHWAV